MSDWLERFKSNSPEKEEEEEETPTVEELESPSASDERDWEDEDVQGNDSLELESFDMDLDEIVADISKTNGYVFASLKAMNEELKAGFTLVRSEQAAIADVNEIMISLNNIADRVDALEEKVTRSLLAMEDGNEKRTLLLAGALEEINDLVADPDGMTDVFKVAPDIGLGAIERAAQGELSDAKPFDPNDEIYLPEVPEKELSVEEPYDIEEEFATQNKVAELVDEEYPELLKDEGGAGEIQSFNLPEELAGQGYTEESYNKVMDYINGDIKWKDIMKYSGGMKQAKALVDPVKASLDML